MILVYSLFRATEVNVQAVVRKIDWRVMLWAAISFSAVRVYHASFTGIGLNDWQ